MNHTFKLEILPPLRHMAAMEAGSARARALGRPRIRILILTLKSERDLCTLGVTMGTGVRGERDRETGKSTGKAYDHGQSG
jgi:hypothetical protein